MPSLLEKPAETPASPLAPTQMLHSRHRWERMRGVLLALLLGLASTLAAVAIAHWGWPGKVPGNVLAAIWGGGLLLTLVAMLVAWRFAPASLLDTAQVMDRKLSTKNRLETAAALRGSSSPLAQAQRDETSAYLGSDPRVRPVRVLPWLIFGVVAMALSHLLSFVMWIMPAFSPPITPPATPPPPKELPRATIVWKSPEAELKANPMEEVPTVAMAQSTTGLRDLSLEISVNGAPKKSVPLPAQPFDQPGKNVVKSSLYLDELGVQPFDIVSYFLRAQRVTGDDKKIPDTTSAIQFVQVRPFRDDVTQLPPGVPAHNKAHDFLIQLKLAQLRSVKENFVLAHTDVPVTDPLRMKENERVGKDQALLSTKTEQVVQFFIQDGVSADIIDLLRQAEAPMDDASKKILATQNAQAMPPQGKALSLIIEVEKFFVKVMTQPVPGRSSAHLEDPFKDKQQHALTKRFETPAGQLEQLAKNQAQVAKDLNHDDSTSAGKSSAAATPDVAQPAPGSDSPAGQSAPPPPPSPNDTAGPDKAVPLPPAQSVDPFGPESGTGTFAERQTRVLQGIGTLLNTNSVLPPEVNGTLQDAQKHATESLRQLDQNDLADAREPAAAAAEDLQRAVAAMNKAGEQQTKVAMEQAQQQLNDLAKELRDLAGSNAPGTQPQGLSDAAAKTQDIQKQLNAAADQQQQAGSAQGAQKLSHLADQINTQNIGKDLAALGKTGLDVNQAMSVAQRMEVLANEAAGAPGSKPSAQDLAQLLNAVEASRANLARLAAKAGAAPGSMPGQESTPSPAGGPGENPAQTPSPEAGGNTPGQQPGDHGNDPGAQAGTGDASGQQPGTGSGKTPEQQPGSGGGDAPGQQAGTGGGDTSREQGGAGAQAFRETLANLKNEAQQISAQAHAVDTDELQRKLNQVEPSSLRHVTPVDVVHAYQALAAPMDKLISDLHAVTVQTQRQDVVEQPDLDEAPLPYRPAVSDYFEAMSRDYHPDDGDADVKKP